MRRDIGREYLLSLNQFFFRACSVFHLFLCFLMSAPLSCRRGEPEILLQNWLGTGETEFISFSLPRGGSVRRLGIIFPRNTFMFLLVLRL